MITSKQNQSLPAENADSHWRMLYKIGGIAVLISIALIPISIIAYFIRPFPDATVSAQEIFAQIQADWFGGLVSLDLLYLLGNLVAIPFFLVLYVTLKPVDESLSLVALVLGLIGLVALIIARPIWEMAVLSDQYAAATTESQRMIYLAAGEAVLSHFHGTAFNVHYFLGSASLLLSSVLMLRSDIYSKATAYLGIAANTLVFGLYVPVIGVYISILSVVVLVAWYIPIAVRLLRLAKA